MVIKNSLKSWLKV